MNRSSSECDPATDSHAFITRFDAGDGPGLRLAVKDCIDVEGAPTTVGSEVIARTAPLASRDAACLSGARAAGARIVGKTNLHELCFGATGVNPHYGTPVNPLDPSRVPGGSSSGSAVAVACGLADVALGTDTGGSIRNPSAFCGVVGLKTTYGRIPVAGTRPLAPSLDTIGPMARDVSSVVAGMALLEPGFAARDPLGPTRFADLRIGRLRGLEADGRIDAGIDSVLGLAARQGATIVEFEVPGWQQADLDGRRLMFGEGFVVNRQLFETELGSLSLEVIERLVAASEVTPDELEGARARQGAWRGRIQALFSSVDVIALPANPFFPAVIGSHKPTVNPAAMAISYAGHPALTLPVPTIDGPTTAHGGSFPAGLQLVGRWGGEEELVAIGEFVEDLLGTGPHGRP